MIAQENTAERTRELNIVNKKYFRVTAKTELIRYSFKDLHFK